MSSLKRGVFVTLCTGLCAALSAAVWFAGVGRAAAGSESHAAAPNALQEFSNKRSSGIFSLPANARSVDWAVLHGGVVAQKVRVTVYKCPVGAPKVAIPPGPVTFTLNPGHTFHNANSVGVGKPFAPGFYYEVVVEDSDVRIHPTVHVWQDTVNTVIPGTRIGPDGFVQTAN